MYSHKCTTAFTHDFDAIPMPTSALPFGTNYDDDYCYHATAANEVSINSCSSDLPTYASTTTTTNDDHRHHEVGDQPRRLLMYQRSVSSHSLMQQKNNNVIGTHRLLLDLLELEVGPAAVRRVYSTGDLDLQRINNTNGVQAQTSWNRSSSESSPLSSESSMIIQGMSKASRYTPQEKRERIERYKTKRNQRNFNKTIKYACRKTLADSRPRIRGRFARNDEIDQKNSSNNVQWSQMSGEGDEEDGNSWVSLLDAFSSIESNSF